MTIDKLAEYRNGRLIGLYQYGITVLKARTITKSAKILKPNSGFTDFP